MDGVGGEDMVDPGEDLGMFKIRGRSPRAPKKGSKKFSKYMILKIKLFFGDALFIGMFLEGKCSRA